jgi:SHS2 domain-containing protein
MKEIQLYRLPRFEVLEHTADVRVAATGETLEETLGYLFGGVIELLKAGDTGAGDEALKTVEVIAPDLERAVVRILNELIYLYDAEGFSADTALEVSVDRLKPEPDSKFDPHSRHHLIRITVPFKGTFPKERGSAPSPKGRTLRFTPVKAATYHDLKISKNRIEVVFDT